MSDKEPIKIDEERPSDTTKVRCEIRQGRFDVTGARLLEIALELKAILPPEIFETVEFYRDSDYCEYTLTWYRWATPEDHQSWREQDAATAKIKTAKERQQYEALKAKYGGESA